MEINVELWVLALSMQCAPDLGAVHIMTNGNQFWICFTLHIPSQAAPSTPNYTKIIASAFDIAVCY